MLFQTQRHEGLKLAFCLTLSSNCINSSQTIEDSFKLPISENVKKVESYFSIDAVNVGNTVQDNFVSVPTNQSDIFKPIMIY